MSEQARNSVRTDMPSDEAVRMLMRLMMKTSAPRILAKRRAAEREKANKEVVNGSVNS